MRSGKYERRTVGWNGGIRTDAKLGDTKIYLGDDY